MTAQPAILTEDASIYLGDCLDVLAEMSDNSIDAIVTDPPYGLGFMGKAWDDLPPGLPWAEECLRVLKPGGHLLAFGGTRTWHRLAVAVEDAGFEVRDSIAWLYGCHDDQTEVLTRRGWVNGLDLTEDDDVAQWATDGTVALVRPSARQRYPFDGRMVRFRNADVDQLVTPNHRVYRQVSERTMTNGERVARWSDWQVDQAADVNRWQRMRLPAAGIHDGPGIGGTDYAALLGWVWADGGFDLSGSGVRIYQSSTNQPYVDEIAALLDRVGPHKRYDYARTWKGAPYTMTTWYMSGDLARQIRADLPGKAPTWDLLWKMTADEKRALWDAAMKGDGSKSARTFWQKDRASLEWVQALLAGIGYRGKIADDPRGALHWSDRPTVELQARHLADDGEDYTGEVWCVTVPSGAFIVRRNGRVSVSGNSGFPKSLDVSKAIDKAARGVPQGGTDPTSPNHGKYRTTTTEGKRWDGDAGQGYGAGGSRFLAPDRSGSPTSIASERMDVPATATTPLTGTEDAAAADGSPTPTPGATVPTDDAAQQWQGWGTALKPAFEPIVVARKPLAAPGVNVLSHVESSLREQGVTGEIKWTSGPASGAARPVQGRSSSATPQPPAGATSANPADASEMRSGERPTGSSSETTTPHGATPTASTSAPTPDARPLSCETKSSPPTATPAPAAESAPASSSPSTTSTAEEPPTERPRGGRSTPKSGAKASLPVTESFAGTATGLTGSRATVRIDRMADGTFVWPEGLPTNVPGGPITVAANVLAHGTGALNIDGTRVQYLSDTDKASARPQGAATSHVGALAGKSQSWTASSSEQTEPSTTAETTGTSASLTEESAPSAAGTPRTEFSPSQSDKGRWPANVLLDGSQAEALDEQSGVSPPKAGRTGRKGGCCDNGTLTGYGTGEDVGTWPADPGGGASRFFPTFRDGSPSVDNAEGSGDDSASDTDPDLPAFRYQAKAPTRERPTVVAEDGTKTAHPTVKPLALMRWLVRLVTPPGGTVLDTFAGSGATIEAAGLEGFRSIGIEREADYLPLIQVRLDRLPRSTM